MRHPLASVIPIAELPVSNIAREFVGEDHDAALTFLIVEAPPGTGPSLHRHAYDEILIIQEGEATLLLGDRAQIVGGGNVVVIPAGQAHGFVNSGGGPLRQIDIHAGPRFSTEWIDEPPVLGLETVERLRGLYDAFNARDVDRVLAELSADVDWPNAWEGGRVRGHDGVVEYWSRQWAAISPTVEPVAFDHRSDGVAVTVHQRVRDRDGALIADDLVVHAYTLRDEQIARMDVEPRQAPA